MRRVLALVHKPRGIAPGQRFRFEQWEPHLRARHGIQLDFCSFESEGLTKVLYERGHVLEKGAFMAWDFARRASVLRTAREYDLVAVYREAASIGPAFYERLLARAGTPFMLDFDDSIWMTNPSVKTNVNGLFARLRFPGKTKTIARLASAVTVGNAYLARWASQHNDNVHVVPTSIELATYPVQPELESDDPFVIGWMGSFSTLIHLEAVRGAVEKFGKTRRVKFIVICDRPLANPFRGVEMEFVKWRGDREAAEIARMHVGIMPLVPLPQVEGKCGCKALQYMAAGRPAIVTPVGVNVEIVKHGQNGLLADTEGEWVDAFTRLAAAPELRTALALAGRKTVETGYSAEASASMFADAVESVLSEGCGGSTTRPARSGGPLEHNAASRRGGRPTPDAS